jgi:hypothetical protein
LPTPTPSFARSNEIGAAGELALLHLPDRLEVCEPEPPLIDPPLRTRRNDEHERGGTDRGEQAR